MEATPVVELDTTGMGRVTEEQLEESMPVCWLLCLPVILS